MNRQARIVLALVTVCFLVSGAAGLIYQVVWARYLALFLGHTSYAVVAILVAFMGGLALGNAWFGRWADRSSKPLAFYGWLEIGIGGYALFFPTYYAFCHDAFVGLARSAQAGSGLLLSLKFLFSLLLVLAPTVLMGATFPLLTRFITRSLGELRERVAALYAINSAGAVAGCLIADFWWIPKYGLELSLFLAAALNIVVGLVSLALSLKTELELAMRVPASRSESTAEIEGEHYSEGQLRLAMIGIGVSGFVAMLYEVAWTRLLALALGSSTHAFSLMLITFITGIAVGAWIVYRWRNLQRTLLAFGWAEVALALTLFGSMFYYQYLSYWFVKLGGMLARREATYPIYEMLQAAICFAVMFIPTVCLGMTLPLVSRIATRELSRVGRSVGTVFAINTVGTVFGAVITGLWLMPTLGLARTFAVGIALNAIIGLAALNWSRLARRPGAMVLPVVVGGLILWYAGAKLDPIWQKAFSLGLWRVPNPPQTLAEFHELADRVPMRYYKDGAGSTVAVYSWHENGKERLTLKVNGKADAGTSSDMITQLLVAHIPLLLRPQSTNVLVVGLGSGMTCGAAARHPNVARVDTVEISPEVVEGARLFGEYNDHILDNPKMHLSIEDAKSYLKITDRKYDVIISEPSNPWMAGVAAVFTREYYESCAQRLQTNGILAQWMHIYETTDETLALVLRTFLTVFPYAGVWQPAAGDLLFIGSLEPLQVDFEAMRNRFADPPVKSDLARVGLRTLGNVLAREMIPQQTTLFAVSPNGPIHSDFYPELEYMAQRGFFLNRTSDQWQHFREDFTPRSTTWFGAYLQKHPLDEEDFQAFAADFRQYRTPDPRLFRSLLLRWQGEAPRPAFPLDLWIAASEQIHTAELRVLRLAPQLEGMLQDAASNPQPLRIYAVDLMANYRSQRSIFYVPPAKDLETALERLLETDPAHQRIYRLYQAELAWDRGQDLRCLELGQTAFDPDLAKGGPVDFSLDMYAPCAVLYCMIESLWRSGRVPQAWALCQQASAGGYIANSGSVFPLLHVSYRRVEAAVAQFPGPQPQP